MTTVFHQNVNTVVPWQAQYTFPSQATNVQKTTVKIQPVGGVTYSPSGNRRIQFQMPSDGYLNPMNSAISVKFEFSSTIAAVTNGSIVIASAGATTATLTGATGLSTAGTYNGWDAIITQAGEFKGRTLRISTHTYASSTATLTFADPLPTDITAATYTVTLQTVPQLQRGGMHELIRRVRVLYGGMTIEDIPQYHRLARALLESGASREFMGNNGAILEGTGSSVQRSWDVDFNPNGSYYVTEEQQLKSPATTLWENGSGGTTGKTYVFNLLNGLSRSKKLLPLKYMAASFVVELELADAAECIICNDTTMSYQLSDVCYIAEMLNFDPLYDASFVQGMRMMGVPLKFTSWHHQERPLTGTGHYQIHERARSCKAVLAVIADTATSIKRDSHIMYHDTGRKIDSAGAFSEDGAGAIVKNFQFRIGGRYFPAQSVNCQNGAAEAYFELLKAINTLGDYTCGGNISPTDWASVHADWSTGKKFIIACELENTDVFPETIAGINAENQSDLTIAIELDGAPADKRMHVFTSFDELLIIRDGHYVDVVM